MGRVAQPFEQPECTCANPSWRERPTDSYGERAHNRTAIPNAPLFCCRRGHRFMTDKTDEASRIILSFLNDEETQSSLGVVA